MAGAASGGIMSRTYKSGSIIYFDGDKSEYIYILKSGRVILTSINLNTGEEVKEDVRIGEFFGVKSALGKYPREETAQTIGETAVLVLTMSDFERLILKNVNIVRKMLSVFSNQLRRIHKNVRSALGETETINPGTELFRIGEHYYKSGVSHQALYAFKKYMEYYADGQHADSAMQRIRSINSGDIGGSDFYAPPSPEKQSEPGGSFLGDFNPSDDDFTVEISAGGAASSDSISSEMDDFFTDGSSLSELEDFSFDDFGAGRDDKGPLEKGDELFDRQKFAEALHSYQEFLSSSDGADNGKLAYANLRAGRCNVRLGQPKNAMEFFSIVVKKYPQEKAAKEAFFEVGGLFESARQNDRALSYYRKVVTIQPSDDITEKAQKKIRDLQG